MEKTALEIEVVDVRKLNGEGNTRALADVKFGNAIIVKGFSVMLGKRGVFVNMPRKAGRDGNWFDILIPTDNALKSEIQDKVLEAYDRETDGVKG